MFGEPKPGLLDFAERVKSVPGRSYRNGDDRHHDLVAVFLSAAAIRAPDPDRAGVPQGDEFSQLGAFA